MKRKMSKPFKLHGKSRGFTLIELMVVLVIAAVLLAVGTPSFRGMLNNNAQAASMNVLVSGVLSARTYAVTHKRAVVIQPVEGDWSNGFTVNMDNAAGEVIATSEFDESDIQVTSDAPLGFLSFDRLGRVTPANSNFTVCNTATSQSVDINVNYFGKASINRIRDNTDPDDGLLIYQAC